MEDQKKPPATEGVDYTGAKKPYVTALLLFAIAVLWTYFTGVVKEKDAEIKRLNEKATARSDDEKKMSLELARSWDRLWNASEKAVRFTDTTGIRSSHFDSPAHAQQPGESR